MSFGSDFYHKLISISSELGMKPEDILAIMPSESGMNPAAGRGNSAAGLIQFMPQTLKNMGYKGSQDDFRKTSATDQLDYVKRYIQSNMSLNGGKPFTSASQLYVANFFPLALKLPGIQRNDPETPFIELYPESVNGMSKKYLAVGAKLPVGQEIAAYKANPLFDKEKKGAITFGDMIRQTDQNKKTSMYRNALSQMEQETGYQAKPNTSSQNMLVHQEKPQTSDFATNFVGLLNDLLSKIAEPTNPTNNLSLKQIYKQSLPKHQFLIQVQSIDYTSSIEFARILALALDEELLSTSYTHTDGSESVEIECSIHGPALQCFAAVQQLSEVMADSFSKIVSSSNVKTKCFINQASIFQPISPRLATTNYRKFLLKFAQKDNQ